MKIGVLLDSLQLELYQGLRWAADHGAQGIQFYASRGPLTPWKSTAEARKTFSRTCADLGLEIASLCGDLGGYGFERDDDNPRRIEQTHQIIDLALELGTPIVTTHIGVIPENNRGPTYETLWRALSELSQYAEKSGAVLAIETGPEPAERLASFIQACGPKGLGVNFDPANLVMVQGCDAVQAFQALAPLVVQVHAKDGRRKKPCDPKAVYAAFAENDFSTIDINDCFEELPLGTGNVNVPRLIDALERFGYTGYLTIEREAGKDRLTDVAQGIRFLEAGLSNSHRGRK
jgi:sugar phosphate isomerase/epimerase